MVEQEAVVLNIVLDYECWALHPNSGDPLLSTRQITPTHHKFLDLSYRSIAGTQGLQVFIIRQHETRPEL